jgi:trimethylamine--corrinoid protein Co-methyltransferase
MSAERRRGGSTSSRAAASKRLARPVMRRLSNPYPPIEQYSADQVEAIHQTSLTILREIGIRVLSDQARQIYRAAGADVDDDTQHVRFDPALLLGAVGQAPAQEKRTQRLGQLCK